MTGESLICLVVLTRTTCVTERRTDGQTAILLKHISPAQRHAIKTVDASLIQFGKSI